MEKAAPTILLADDDADVRAIVVSALTILGFRVVEATDGKAALTAFDRELPELVILDVMMPELDGFEVCRIIKEHDEGAYVPVLMLTARDTVRDKVHALDGGADEYVTKPFNYQELQARVRALLRVRHLNVRLRDKNRQLADMQAQLVAQERQLVAAQLGGGAAHELGQPLAAITLNLHLLELLPKDDERFVKALGAMKVDLKRTAEILEKLRRVDPSKTEPYHGSSSVVAVCPPEPERKKSS